MDKDELRGYGIDLEKGLANCMGNLPFYKKILSMFIKDQCFPRAREAFAAGDQRELFSRMHELKGISGNAALTEVYGAAVPLVELLRPGDAGADEVAELFGRASRAYDRACEGIALFIAEE